jgi:hypothetical protein
MKTKTLPEGCIIVIDPHKYAVKAIKNSLKPLLKDALLYSFTDSKSAKHWFQDKKDSIEPKLLISDNIGVVPQTNSFAQQVRQSFPRAHILLYSESITEKQVVTLQNEDNLINRYVSKDKNIAQLADTALKAYSEYERQPVLKSIRQYIAECSKPEEPFTTIGDKDYSLINVYREIVLGTELGMAFEEVWLSLLLKSVSIRAGEKA